MKFLADMGISPKITDFLRGLGYEAMHLHEEGLDRLPDSDILSKARREGYVVLTSDLDFGGLIAASGAELPSVVIFRLKNMRFANVKLHMQEIVNHHIDVLVKGAVLSVTERRIRIRNLPIEKDE